MFPRIVEEPDGCVQALEQGGRRSVPLVGTEASSTARKADRRLARLLVDIETLSELIALQESEDVLSAGDEGGRQTVAETRGGENGRISAWGVEAVAGLAVRDARTAASFGGWVGDGGGSVKGFLPSEAGDGGALLAPGSLKQSKRPKFQVPFRSARGM